ncbi:MAG: hypothetical protein MJ220_04145 [Bacilli bacterium]|nr:hypothetical protein [Bacilli bacterium]
MKKNRIMILSAIALIMAGCGKGGDTSNVSKPNKESSLSNESSLIESSIPSSESSSVNEKARSFIEFASVLQKAANKEAFVSNSSTCTETNVAGDVKDVLTSKVDIYNGMYSLAKGTLKTYLRNEVTVEDEFTDIKCVDTFKYIVDDKDYSQLMFFDIRDFKNDASSKNTYKDSASRLYVADNEFEVGDLAEGSYVSSEEAEFRTTMMHTTYLLNFIDQYFYANAYAEQSGATYMNRNVMGDGSIEYDVHAAYEVDGDMNDTDHVKIDFEAKFDSKEEKLLSFSTSYVSDDISKADKNNHYLSSMEKTATLTYEQRGEAAKDYPDPYDYFLADVSEVELLGTQRDVLDPSKISPANSYIFITPKTYSPAKAIGIDEFTLMPVSSSNPEAVKVETTKNGSAYFIVEGKGEATLTYSYVGKDEKGFYKVIEKTLNVNVREYSEPAGIAIQYIEDVNTHDMLDGSKGDVNVGAEYRMICNVVDAANSTKNVPQGITVAVSDPSLVTINVEGGVIRFTPIKEGAFTIKIVSNENPEVVWEKQFTAYDNSKVDIADILVANTWARSWSYIGYIPSEGDTGWHYIDATLKFNKDGTGTAVYNDKTIEKVYNDPFTWKVEDEKIYIVGLDKCGYYTGDIAYALLVGDGTTLNIYTTAENGGDYEYKAVAK